MKFGRVPVDQAEGKVLAHSMVVHKKRWKKGRILSRLDVDVLQGIGVETVVAATLNSDDIDEDSAAEALARTLAGPGVRIRPAATGRCNLYAEHRGLLRLNADHVNRINSVSEIFTVGTLRPFSIVYKDELLVTIKIIPYAVSRDALNDVISVSGQGYPPVSVCEFKAMKIGLIQTKNDSFNTKLLQKGLEMLGTRVEQLGSEIVAHATCEHHENRVTESIQQLVSKELDMILLLGASAIQDREDVIPKGIVNAGGRIEHFGMPMDPGNLLLVAQLGRMPILGLPGCVRSPKRNGFDFVLERLVAGLEVRSEEVMNMGVGGILSEGPRRPERRTQMADQVKPESKRIAAIILAAGQSRRMGKDNKLLMKLGNNSVIRTVVDNVGNAQIDDIILATGHDRELIENEIKDKNLTIAHNPEFVGGLSTTLRTALAALPQNVSGVLVCQGDMPFVQSSHINSLIQAFDPLAGRNICVPTHRGKRGNPVLWDRRYIPEMMEVRGDVGAKHIIGEYEEFVKEIAIDDPAVLTDLDTPEAFRQHADVDISG